jgi:uroporphyrinogen-III synthase
MILSNKRIFISRTLNSDSPFIELSRNNDIVIIDESLIQITQIRFSYTPQTNWIFFTSKNSIDCFFAQDPNFPETVKYGVISHTSEKHLLMYNKQASFVGCGVDLLKIAKDFRDVLENESVLFPQAIDSYQTIQKQLAFTNTCNNLYVYKTTIKTDFDIPYSDILIFTSPSNVEAYFNKYKIDVRQFVIAMGASTKYKLKEFGVSKVFIPKSFDEQGLLNVLIENSLVRA